MEQLKDFITIKNEGEEWFVITSDGDKLPIDTANKKWYEKGQYYYYELPKNNVTKTINENKLVDGKIIYEREKKSGEGKSAKSTKTVTSLERFLTDEELIVYNDLIEKANKRRAIAIARQAVEDAKKLYEDLLKENQVDAE